MPPIEKADDSRREEAYLRHGPFRRKLDRIRGGTAHLTFLPAVCAPCAAFAAFALTVVLRSKTNGYLFSAPVIVPVPALLIYFPVSFIRAVSRMDRKVLKRYLGAAVIRPDHLDKEQS